jgi:hypothetical protein
MAEPIPEPMPFMFEPGDMGEFERVQVGVTAGGAPVYGRRQVKPATYTGGYNADGTPTRARPWQVPR